MRKIKSNGVSNKYKIILNIALLLIGYKNYAWTIRSRKKISHKQPLKHK